MAPPIKCVQRCKGGCRVCALYSHVVNDAVYFRSHLDEFKVAKSAKDYKTGGFKEIQTIVFDWDEGYCNGVPMHDDTFGDLRCGFDDSGDAVLDGRVEDSAGGYQSEYNSSDWLYREHNHIRKGVKIFRLRHETPQDVEKLSLKQLELGTPGDGLRSVFMGSITPDHGDERYCRNKRADGRTMYVVPNKEVDALVDSSIAKAKAKLKGGSEDEGNPIVIQVKMDLD